VGMGTGGRAACSTEVKSLSRKRKPAGVTRTFSRSHLRAGM
jgi:hypothetical protein